jgi:hypothetical protein
LQSNLNDSVDPEAALTEQIGVSLERHFYTGDTASAFKSSLVQTCRNRLSKSLMIECNTRLPQ